MNRLLDPRQRRLPTQHFQRLKQRRRILPAANRDANGLKHLSRLDSQFLRGSAESLIQRIVLEFNIRQHFARSRENLQRHGQVSLLRDQLGRIVGRQLVDKEEIGRSEHVAQQLDALPDQRRDP